MGLAQRSAAVWEGLGGAVDFGSNDEVLYSAAGVNSALLSGTVDMTLSGSTLTITLTNTSIDAAGSGAGVLLTGIGFLGAGVIVKYGFSVRGLTTAASIWTTAVIGVLIGSRYYWEAAASVLLVLGALSVFRHIEDQLEKENFAQVKLGVTREPGLALRDIAALFAQANVRIEEVAYGLEKNRSVLDYEYVVSTLKPENLALLAELLTLQTAVTRFHISPSHD